MPQEITDLIIKIQQGDQAAFAQLYEQFSERIYKYIRSKIADKQSAEDIFQEVFLKAWRGCQNLQTKDLNFSAWLYKVSHNTINDYFRKQYRSPETVELDYQINIPAPDNVSKEIDDKLSFDNIRKAIEDLPASYKQIIELRFYQQFSIEETAKIMGKSNISIRVLQYRATRKLEQLVKRYE